MSVSEKISVIIFLISKYEQKNTDAWILKCEQLANGQISKFMVLYQKPPKNDKNMRFGAKNVHFSPIWAPRPSKKHFFDTSCVCLET